MEEIKNAMREALDPEAFRRMYSDFAEQNPLWNDIPSSSGLLYAWDEKSFAKLVAEYKAPTTETTGKPASAK